VWRFIVSDSPSDQCRQSTKLTISIEWLVVAKICSRKWINRIRLSKGGVRVRSTREVIPEWSTAVAEISSLPKGATMRPCHHQTAQIRCYLQIAYSGGSECLQRIMILCPQPVFDTKHNQVQHAKRYWTVAFQLPMRPNMTIVHELRQWSALPIWALIHI
jgi:hypothetical protein